MSAYNALKITKAFGELSKLRKIIEVLQTSFPMLANVITGVRGSMEAGFTATQTFKIALSGLWDVIKAHPIIALTAAVIAVASAISFAQKKAEEARQQQAEKNKEAIDTYNQEQESLENLISKYKELANSDKTDSSNREAIKKVQDEITNLVGEQAKNLDLVNGKLDDELQKINAISKTNQENATTTFRSAFTSEYDKWGNTYFNNTDNGMLGGLYKFLNLSNNNRITVKGGVGNSQDKALTTEQDRALRELIEEIYSRRGETFKGSTNDFYLSENISERIKELREIVNLLGDTGATESEQFKDFSSYLTTMEEMMSSSVEATNNLMKNLLGVKLNSVDTVSKLNNISSLDEYSSMRDSLISELSDDSQIKQALSQGFINKESIEKFVDDTLSTLPQISTYYNQWVGEFKDTSKNAGNIVKTSFSDLIADEDFQKQVDGYKDKLTELDEALEKLRSGDLGEEDKIELFKNFPELAGQADNLDEAIVNLINDTEGSAIADFNEQLDNMDTDDDVVALNALKNSILGLAKTKNGVADLKSEISKLKTALDDLSDTYSNMKSIIDDYNENGYLTLDNLQSIMDMQPEYINLLIDENGQVNLNNQAYKEYVASKAKSLLVNELQDLYSSILGMKVEEAQAYANAKAYNEETRSVQDLLTATTQLYYAKAMAKDSANNTTAYTDAMSRSFNTAANYASMVDNYINSLSTSQNEFNHVTNEATESTNDYKDALEAEKDALEDTKDLLEDYKDELSDAQSSLKDLIDLVTDYIKQTKEDEKSALEEQIDTLDKQKDALDESKEKYADLIDKKKEAIKAAYDEKKAQDELLDKQKSVAKDRLALEVAGLDDSSAGRKAQKQARDNLVESEKNLHEYQDDRAYDFQIKELEDLQTKFEEGIEKRKAQIDTQVEYIESKIDEIDKYLDNSRQLYEDACAMIDNDNGTLYSNLWNYTYQYTTQTKAEFDHLWTSAQEALAKYRGDNDSLLGVMETLQTEIYNTEGQIADLDLQIDEVGKSIDTMNQQINNSSGAINNVSSSIGGLASNLADYKRALDELANANNIENGNNSTKYGWKINYMGREWSTGNIYNADNQVNRNLAASQLANQIAKARGLNAGELSGVIQDIQDLLGVPHFASGTRHSPTEFISQENGLEAIFAKNPNGSGSYTLTTPDSQVFDAKRTDNLYNFSGNPEEFISKLADRGLSLLSGDELSALGWGRSIDVSQLFSGLFNSPDFVKNLTGVAGATYNNDNSASNDVYSISMPIQIYGNPDQSVVQAFNRLIPTFKKEMINELVRIGEKYRR